MPSILSVRLDPATSAALTAAAQAAGMSVSGFARAATVKALPDAATLPAARPSPARRRIFVPDTDVVAVAALAAEVAKLTGAMIQLAKALRETGHTAAHQSVESVLRDHRAAQTSLVAIISRLRRAEAS